MGRPLGSKNKATADTKAAFRRLVDKHEKDLDKWLKAVAEDDPGHALEIVIKLAEFCVPKLARTQVTGGDDGPVVVKLVAYSEKER